MTEKNINSSELTIINNKVPVYRKHFLKNSDYFFSV